MKFVNQCHNKQSRDQSRTAAVRVACNKLKKRGLSILAPVVWSVEQIQNASLRRHFWCCTKYKLVGNITTKDSYNINCTQIDSGDYHPLVSAKLTCEKQVYPSKGDCGAIQHFTFCPPSTNIYSLSNNSYTTDTHR